MSEPTPQSEAPAPGEAKASRGWGSATLTAGAMLLASYLLFVLIPNNLLTYLTVHVNTRARDLLIVIWWLVALVFGCWLFVRLQRGRVR
jgi:hypothetical protein